MTQDISSRSETGSIKGWRLLNLYGEQFTVELIELLSITKFRLGFLPRDGPDWTSRTGPLFSINKCILVYSEVSTALPQRRYSLLLALQLLCFLQ